MRNAHASVTNPWLKWFCQWCLICCAFCGAIASAQVINVDTTNRQESFDIITQSESIRTAENQQLSEIQNISGWQPRWETMPLAEDQALWIRAQVQNNLGTRESFYLSVSDSNLDIVDVFILDELGRIVHSYLSGVSRSFQARQVDHRHFVSPFSVDPNQRVTIYIRIRDSGLLLMPISLSNADTWISSEQNKQILFGIFVGSSMVFTLYFLVTYLLMRSPVRFWFSLACFTLMLTVLNMQGFVSHFTRITQFASFTTAILMALLMFTMAKVSCSMFIKSPRWLRVVSYVLPMGYIPIWAIFEPSSQAHATVSITVACVLSQCLKAAHYRHRFSSKPSQIFILGWLCLALAAGVNLYIYVSAESIDQVSTLIIMLLCVIGTLNLAVAIESNEKALIRVQQSQQEQRIDDLKQFYQLFRNSAEGLYTSTPEGKLVSVNPAMWQLFGYKNEDDMLSSVQSTDDFYANSSDRDVLIGELRANKVVLGREFLGLRKDGSEFWFSLSCQFHQEADQSFLYGSVFDVTERKQSNISLEYLATHDSLTGVNNRREFERCLQLELGGKHVLSRPMALLYLDLDQFKVVNDTCGHKAGDALLQQLARVLDEVVGKKGLLSRLGGDEFGVLMTNSSSDEAYVLATKLLNAVSDFRFMWENKVFSLGLSIGLVERTDKIDSPEQMMSMADAACYIAKEQGRNQIHRYSSDDVSTRRYENELNWLAYINEALDNDNFRLHYQHYQPLREAPEGHRYEILVRMQTEDKGLVPPGAFLPAAERYSLGAKIDRWVIHNYFEWLSINPEHANKLHKCNINLCGQSLADRDFKLFVLNAFEKFSIPYKKICFEITEGMAIIKLEETLEFIKTFKQLGCTFALDDFGSGFSSYGYLKRLPVQYVKIDGAFVRDLNTDPIDSAMVRSINDVAKAMGMETVAEFVENAEVRVQLGKMGVDYAQGYGIAMPSPLLEFKAFNA